LMCDLIGFMLRSGVCVYSSEDSTKNGSTFEDSSSFELRV